MKRALALIAAAGAAGAAGCHRRSVLAKPVPKVPDAGVADAEVEVPDAMPDAPPPTITFAPAPWAQGQSVRVWRKAILLGVPGSADVTSDDALALQIASPADGGVLAIVGDDCRATIAHGTAKVTGDCGGRASDVAYKLDLAAQLLTIPRGTMTVGQDAGGFGRALVGLFRLQDAGAIVTAHLAVADEAGATFAVHVELDGTMLRPGLHVLGALDGEIHIDVAASKMTGALRAAHVTVSGYPQADFTAKGALELDFGIEPK